MSGVVGPMQAALELLEGQPKPRKLSTIEAMRGSREQQHRVVVSIQEMNNGREKKREPHPRRAQTCHGPSSLTRGRVCSVH